MNCEGMDEVELRVFRGSKDKGEEVVTNRSAKAHIICITQN